MPLRAGLISPRPTMDLMYKVQIARLMPQATGGIDPAGTWVLLPQIVQCDVLPLDDAAIFAQSGQQNIATHILHFYAKTDVQPRDKVKILSTRRLAGPIGSWYEIMNYMGPAETLAYIRCHARITGSAL